MYICYKASKALSGIPVIQVIYENVLNNIKTMNQLTQMGEAHLD